MELVVNGERYTLTGDSDRTLLQVLRTDLELTGSKYACGEGVCGACTVLVDGHHVRSCTTRLGDVANRTVTTIEGLAQDGRLHPLQQAFLEADALQCGYCTPGMIMTALSLLTTNADPSSDEIIAFMQGNICRCAVYPQIISAIRVAARKTSTLSDQPQSHDWRHTAG